MRFVSGTGYAARQLTRRITGTRQTVPVTVPAYRSARYEDGVSTAAAGIPATGDHPLATGRGGHQ